MKLAPIIVVLAVLTLAGCSSATAPSTPASMAPSTASTTPKPTPRVMTTAEAGEQYLRAVCPTNTASANLDRAYSAQDLAKIKATATIARDALRSEIVIFEDPMMLWPEVVRPDIKTISETDFRDLSTMDSMSKASDLASANAISFGSESGAAEASQRIRLRLGLSADTAAGCS